MPTASQDSPKFNWKIVALACVPAAVLTLGPYLAAQGERDESRLKAIEPAVKQELTNSLKSGALGMRPIRDPQGNIYALDVYRKESTPVGCVQFEVRQIIKNERTKSTSQAMPIMSGKECNNGQ